MNHAVFAGNIGQDARTNTVGESNTPVANFSLAVNERHKDKDVTTWIDCALWGKRAEALGAYLTKGSKVTVAGSVSVDSFTKDNGEVVPKLKLNVREITLQGGGQQSGQSQGQGPAGGGKDPHEDDIPFMRVDWRFA